MNFIISHPTGILNGSIDLPLSKSESNRILIVQALSKGKVGVEHLSDARDTKLLQEALRSALSEINVKDAGTTMRFLTAYYCATNQHKILTGSERMCERPIGILVDALREIGFVFPECNNAVSIGFFLRNMSVSSMAVFLLTGL